MAQILRRTTEEKRQPVAKQLVKTYCLMCGTRCPVVCTVQDGRLKKVIPDVDHPLGGTFCVKGASAPEFVYDETRLRYPMKRTNPKTSKDPGWVRISWDEALDITAKKLLEVRSKYGPEAVAFYRPALGGSASADYQPWLQRLVFAYGSPNYAKTTHICNWHKDVGSKYTYGVGIPEPDYSHSGCILIWGTNPSNTDVRHAVEIQKGLKNGAKLVIIDPKRIQLSSKAAVHLNVKPGTDLALALGLINQVISRGLYDKDFVLRWTNSAFLVRGDTRKLLTESDLKEGGRNDVYYGWDSAGGRPVAYDPAKVSFGCEHGALKLDASVDVSLKDGRKVACSSAFKELAGIVSGFTPERVTELTGIPSDDVIKAAELISTSRPLSYFTYNGLEQHTDAMQINRAICILYGLVGDFDRKGGNVIYPDLEVNPVMGFGFLPPDSANKRLGGKARPLGPGGTLAKDAAVQAYDVYGAILDGRPYPVKAFMSFGGNLIVSNGDTARGLEALRKLDFYMHIDFYENPTARLADILLPAASSWEAETVGRWEVRDTAHVQLRRKVVEPEYERRGDVDVIFDLAVRLGLGDKFFEGKPERGYDHLLAPLGKTVSDLRNSESGFTYPLRPRYAKYGEADPKTGNPVGFETPTRLLEVYSTTFEKYGYDPLPAYREPRETVAASDRFPLVLTAFKPIQFTHGSYRSVPGLRRQFPEPLAYVHPETAKAQNVADGEWVEIQTQSGSVRARAKHDPGVAKGVVIGQEGWWQGCANLGLAEYDPFAKSGSNLNLIVKNEMIDPISGSVAMRGVPCALRSASSRP